MKDLLSIENYTFYSALLLFVFYFLFAQGKKVEQKKATEKPKIKPIEIFKNSKKGIDKKILDKLLKGHE